MIDDASVEQLKNSMDIVEIISNYIEVKKRQEPILRQTVPFMERKHPALL